MKLVKRCNDNVIALLIILLALHVRFAFQKIQLCHRFHPPYQKNIRNTWNSLKAPRSRRGK